MGIPKIVLCDTHLDLMNKGSIYKSVYRNMALLVTCCWFYITTSLFLVLKFIGKHVFRIKMEDNSRRDDSKLRFQTINEALELEEEDHNDIFNESIDPVVTEILELEEKGDDDFFNEKESLSSEGVGPKELAEDESGSFEWNPLSNFSFKFQYQISENTLRSIEEVGSPLIGEIKPSTNTDVFNYSFLSEKNFSGFVREPQDTTFRIQDSHVDRVEDDKTDEGKLDTKFDGGFLLSEDFQQFDAVRILENHTKTKEALLFNDELIEDKIPIRTEVDSLKKRETLDEGQFLPEVFSSFDSDSESISSDGYSVKELVVDSDSDGFLSDRDFGENEHELDATETYLHSDRYKGELLEDIGEFDRQLKMFYDSDSKSDDFEGGCVQSTSEINQKHISDGFHKNINNELLPDIGFHEPKIKPVEKLRIPEETHLPFSSPVQLEFTDSNDDQHSSFRTDSTRLSSVDDVFSAKALSGPETKSEDLNGNAVHNFETEFDDSINRFSKSVGRENEQAQKTDDLRYDKKSSQKSEGNNFEDLDAEDLDELESLWEHQDLIEQLRLEIKKARAIGLPTILEESESPKTIEDLKPWKIDENFLRENPMDELHKFYKAYRERMRKFDILNYQKMYAIGFLKLKDPFQSLGFQKPLIPTIISHVAQNFWPLSGRRLSTDPSKKFLKELQFDLETVYIGQACLSWEFLRWQYEKARGLPELDPYRSHQYNQVAGEFQQFQVNIQRFVENESFQGPRLPNFVNSRCLVRNLLQVPIIKEDCLKQKMEGHKTGEGAITSDMLEDIMEESIRVFWEFVKADKNETPAFLKGLIGSQAELQDPSDYELMVDLQAVLQKKDKKLKDILRTGNCLVKKFKKPREDRSNQDLFFSQVDLKLVAMVLRMSRISKDQLVWCHKKLNKISFTGKKVRREPSFLLFPC